MSITTEFTFMKVLEILEFTPLLLCKQITTNLSTLRRCSTIETEQHQLTVNISDKMRM